MDLVTKLKAIAEKLANRDLTGLADLRAIVADPQEQVPDFCEDLQAAEKVAALLLKLCK